MSTTSTLSQGTSTMILSAEVWFLNLCGVGEFVCFLCDDLSIRIPLTMFDNSEILMDCRRVYPKVSGLSP
jgi:hypothetical protein